VIRHRAHGLGHPYRLDPDQRVPAQPVAGEPLELRATTDAAISRLLVDVRRNGRLQTLAAERLADQAALKTGSGHLAGAAERGEATTRARWHVVLDGLTANDEITYRFHDGNGRGTPWHSATVAGWQPDGGTLAVEGDDDRLLRDSVRWLTAGDGVVRARFSLRLGPHEHPIGFGERFNALDQSGQTFDSIVFEQYTNQGKRTYLPMPFAIIAGGGWGFHVDTPRRVWFDVGASLIVEVDVDPADPTVALQIFAGAPSEVLDAFLERTGRPKLPPDWVFGPWMSANEWNTQARTVAEVQRSMDEDIPVGVLVLEAWSDESTFTAFRDAVYEEHADGSPHRLDDFTFPADGAWPDPKGMVDWLHERGIRLLLWQIPLLKALPSPQGQLRHDRAALVERGFAVRKGDGRPYGNRGWWFPRAMLPDFTLEEARVWWTEKRRYLLEELGVDGFKTDGGEHAWGADLRYGDGTTGADSNSRYPVLYAQAYHELFERVGRDAITFSRAGYTGSAAYPCHWAGDEASTWPAFRSSLTAGLSAGASGIFFWTWDLAGFSGEIPSAELYARSSAVACFAPIMQYHAEYNHHRVPSGDRTPWNIAERTGDERVLAVYRRYAKLRMRLVPYLVAEAKKCVEQSKPLMRALAFDVQGDEEIWHYPYQFLCGEHLLVAPVTEEGAAELEVYLPAGDWVDAWTGERHEGLRKVRRPAPFGVIPVYVAAGCADALLPLFAPWKED
jgi:alpha-glucosidase (family GH31 glycosyl hydrolase)